MGFACFSIDLSKGTKPEKRVGEINKKVNADAAPATKVLDVLTHSLRHE